MFQFKKKNDIIFHIYLLLLSDIISRTIVTLKTNDQKICIYKHVNTWVISIPKIIDKLSI